MTLYRWIYRLLCWASVDEACAPTGVLPWYRKAARKFLPVPRENSKNG